MLINKHRRLPLTASHKRFNASRNTSNKLAILGLALAVACPIVLYLANFSGGLSKNHSRWGEFGSYLSGVYGSLALAVLIYTTISSQNQFRRQSDDNIFYRLLDALQARIQHTSISVGEGEVSAYSSVKHIAEIYNHELSQEAVLIARNLFCRSPESIQDVHYLQLFQLLHPNDYLQKLELYRDEFINQIRGSSNRWELLKYYLGAPGFETGPIKDVLRATGSVNFYKISFQDRQHHYSAALGRVMDNYGQFLDGYIETLLHISAVAAASSFRLEYARYLQSQLTNYEIVIAFYILLGSGSDRRERGQALYELGLFSRLKSQECQLLMIDWPQSEIIDRELSDLFTG